MEPPQTSPVIRNTVKRKVDGDINLGLSIKKKYILAKLNLDIILIFIQFLLISFSEKL